MSIRITSKLSPTAIDFQHNVQAVLQLSNLDRGLLDAAIYSIEERDKRLQKAGIHNHRMLSGPTVKHLKDIRENDSLRPGFQALVNQSVVLLASYFASGVSQLFRVAIAAALETNLSDHLKNLQLKLSVAELAELAPDLRERLPDIIAESPGISFQDTKSITRTFLEFFGFEIPRDKCTNEITASLAFRHVLVHSGGIVDRQCIRQIENATPRTLKSKIAVGDELHFKTDEVGLVAHAMVTYVERLAKGLEGKMFTANAHLPDDSTNAKRRR